MPLLEWMRCTQTLLEEQKVLKLCLEATASAPILVLAKSHHRYLETALHHSIAFVYRHLERRPLAKGMKPPMPAFIVLTETKLPILLAQLAMEPVLPW